MIYRIGKVQDPRADDPTFRDWSTALTAAIDMSMADTWVVAIWTADGSIAALCYQGGVFR